jgi:hypothetical protein
MYSLRGSYQLLKNSASTSRLRYVLSNKPQRSCKMSLVQVILTNFLLFCDPTKTNEVYTLYACLSFLQNFYLAA